MDKRQRFLRYNRLDSCTAMVLCLAPAGRGASSFNSWQKSLPEWVGVPRLQLPGRDDLQHLEPLSQIDDIIHLIVNEIAGLPKLPYVIYGQSLGAIVGFELLRAMREQNLHLPLSLFVSSRRAPQLPLSHVPLYSLPNHELLEVFRAMGNGFLTPFEHPNWRDRLFKLSRADLEVSDAYDYRDDLPLNIPITAFRGEQDCYVHETEVRAWGDQTSAQFQFETLPGRHFFETEGISKIHSMILATLNRTTIDRVRFLEAQ